MRKGGKEEEKRRRKDEGCKEKMRKKPKPRGRQKPSSTAGGVPPILLLCANGGKEKKANEFAHSKMAKLSNGSRWKREWPNLGQLYGHWPCFPPTKHNNQSKEIGRGIGGIFSRELNSTIILINSFFPSQLPMFGYFCPSILNFDSLFVVRVPALVDIQLFNLIHLPPYFSLSPQWE
jgi:hypothetical protein